MILIYLYAWALTSVDISNNKNESGDHAFPRAHKESGTYLTLIGSWVLLIHDQNLTVEIPPNAHKRDDCNQLSLDN